MGTEACPECGHLTKVYADAGKRKHEEGCSLAPIKCDCGVGEALPGEIRHHRSGCDLFRYDSDEWRALHAAMLVELYIERHPTLKAEMEEELQQVERIGYLCIQGYPKRICSGCTSACIEPVFAYPEIEGEKL